ncbi:MAG: phenylalanine--tRNA ligase subunit alpha [Candidatus Levybacteria bacterium RIFCSPHIGHO2_02_FULL_37_13]|nr:MAG: phenylalanine--tRNA ligase subunit alpha [Candidatus Levybacteria bacterium RIFCSPHIGHO2_02_FULL_37_13]OGH29453.1 MAG: phenylalanine--tRNA ligase subunit alpha [Candidatus Levybacteria bacterium RIFCSPHIGHO2_12_FULL_37_9]
MEEELIQIKNTAVSLILDILDRKTLEEVKLQFLGRSGKLTLVIKEIAKLPKEDRPEVGRLANEVKKAIEDTIANQELRIRQLTDQESGERKEKIDTSVPGIKPDIGHLHPMTQVLMDVVDVFKTIGFQVADGPEIETDYYNFEVLNIPKDHPSRDTQQTLFLDTRKSKVVPGEVILRTQTSAMQGRIMEKIKPPVRAIVPGKNFRYEQVDASHGFEFWQVEGFLVDTSVRLTDLFGTIDYVLRKLMGEGIKLKFATTNFPFVEPGVDTYIQCTVCNGRGCSFCKQSGWSEIMPAGMIHPNVLKAVGYDSQKVTGFAFAIGLSRLVTLRYQMDDLRLLTNPDMRILEQF